MPVQPVKKAFEKKEFATYLSLAQYSFMNTARSYGKVGNISKTLIYILHNLSCFASQRSTGVLYD